MFRQTHFGFDWGEFITGIALLIGAVVMLRNPGATLLTLTFIFAIIAITRGIATLAAWSKLRQFTGKLSWLSLLAGIADLALGVLFLFQPGLGTVTLTYLFAGWFLIDSIASLVNAGHLRQAGTGWVVIEVILDLLAVFVGVMLLMNPVTSMVSIVTLLAMFFGIFGVNAIVVAFARRNI
ncbi:HdeD family acid-resistance protein [Lacticaseibacillus yichunensis]|uniref:HdeD family acid-resistance protein n=1 Tax=Lacticaseibacillus yichunensis TaxID=2486015 RepID=A0ABW4CQS6_9LACO|nr:DUF308 domain-containing protein [Lacticaseibacillus yichunensis]